MKRLLLTLMCIASMLGAAATSADSGLWSLHLSYHKASQAVCAGSTTYVLFDGNLLAYDSDDQSVRTFDKLSGLSDKGVAFMGRSDTQKCVVLFYGNRNVDLLYDNGTVMNIPQIKNFTDYSITAKGLNVSGDWATVTTTEGIIVLNLAKAEVYGYYRLGSEPKTAAVAGKMVFACIDGVCKLGKLSDNLYDPSQWKTVCDFPVSDVIPFGNGAFLAVPYVPGKTELYSGLTYMDLSSSGEAPTLTQVSPVIPAFGNYSNGHIQFVGSGYLVTVDAAEPLKEQLRIPLAQQPVTLSRGADGTFWMVYFDGTLKNYKAVGGESIEDTGVSVGGFGPLHDDCYNLYYAGSRLLVAGGRFDYTGKQYEPTALAYENNTWTFFQYKDFMLNDNAKYRNVLSVIQDPSDASHHYVSSSSGLLEFRDFCFVNHFSATNSPIEVAAGASGNVNYNVVDGLNFDSRGNLWLTNYEAKFSLKAMKPDGSWFLPELPSFTKIPTPEKTLVDNEDRVWVTSRRTVSNSVSGLLGYDYNGTLDDVTDDKAIYRSTAVNEDGNSCNIEYVYDICQDRAGKIWFGCASGVYAIENPDDWFSSSCSLYQPKVPRNDGTNYADYLLTGISVTAIAVDGGNRKWLGTLGSGIYLVSPDGSEVLEHFTADNSPLLSDDVHSLAVNPANGELMIGTQAGLCSYRTGVTPPVVKLSDEAVRVYPNPVRPEYMGKVTITGLTDGAEVKVVSAGSQLVARGNAVGGTFIWDVRSSASGRRVAPGVYYLLIATVDGSDGVAAKVVVI